MSESSQSVFSGAKDTSDWVLRRSLVIACGLSLALLMLLGIWQSSRPLWQDESSLLANLGLPWQDYFSMLPYHDQAAPPFSMVLLDQMWQIADGEVQPMRLAILFFTALILVALATAAARQGSGVMLLALAIVALSPTTLRYSGEIKHYIFELLAALVVVQAALSIRVRGLLEPVLFVALGLCLSFFSFSVMLIVAVALVDAMLFRAQRTDRIRWLMATVVFCILWGLLYLWIFKPLTQLQLANYPDTYRSGLFLEVLRQTPGSLPRRLLYVAGQPVFAIAGAVICLAGLLLSRRSRLSKLAGPGLAALRRPEGTAVRLWLGLTILILFLSFLGFYPLSSSRQLLFTMAPTAAALASAVLGLLRVSGVQSFVIALALVLLPGAAMEIRKTVSGDFVFQDTAALYGFLKSAPEVAVIPNMLFDPTLRYYVARDPSADLRIVGLLSAESGAMESSGEVIERLDRDDPSLSSHIWQALRREGGYRAYADRIVRLAQGEGEAHFAVAQLSERSDAYLPAAATAAGCTAETAFVAVDVIAYRISCPVDQQR